MKKLKKISSFLTSIFLVYYGNSCAQETNNESNNQINNLNSLLDDNLVNSESKIQKNDTIEIKIRCAGSGHTSPYKYRFGSPSNDYLKYEDSGYLDMSENNIPYISRDSNNIIQMGIGSESINNEIEKNKLFLKLNKLKKNDLFFKIKNKNGIWQLDLLRPGVGSEYDFNNKSTNKLFKIINKGDFSLNNTSKVVFNSLIDCIDQIISDNNFNIKNINIKLQGHSRGGVSVARALDKLLYKLNKNEYLERLQNKKITIDCVLLDPVAGLDTPEKRLRLTSNNPSVDVKLTQLISTDIGFDKWKHMFFGSSAFIPTNISNSTIVFLPLNHDVGQRNFTRDDSGKYRKIMWIHNGKQLKFGEIGQLDPGVYIPITKFTFNKNDPKEILLSSERAPEDRVIPPVELAKITDCSQQTLYIIQDRLLLDKAWIKNAQRKKIFLKLLNKSLHINGILNDEENIKFNSNFKLYVN